MTLLNEAQQAYIEGANVAYVDCAIVLEGMARNAPPQLKKYVEAFPQLAAAFRKKGATLQAEMESFLTATRN